MVIDALESTATKASLLLAAASSAAGVAARAYVLGFLNPKLFLSPVRSAKPSAGPC